MPISDLWSDIDPGEETANGSQEQEREELQKLRRKQQTSKANKARLEQRVRRQEQQQHMATHGSKDADTWGSIMQRKFFTHRLFNYGGLHKEQDYQKQATERARCTYSLLRKIVGIVQKIFQGDPGNPRSVHHVVNSIVADDTDTRLRSGTGRSTIHTVCNTVQSLHVRYTNPGSTDACRESLNVLTPMVLLASPKMGDIHAATTAFSLVCGSQIGALMRACGLTAEMMPLAPSGLRTEIFVGDALKANAASWRIERAILAKHNAEHNEKIYGIQVKCQVHQLNLIRKPMALSINQYWASLVRLSHLFEQHSFRQAFGSALADFLQRPKGFQRR